MHSKKFFGVLNGIDEEVWDPATDTLIDYQYSADDVDGKYVNKQKLRERLGLGSQGDDQRRPLVQSTSLFFFNYFQYKFVITAACFVYFSFFHAAFSSSLRCTRVLTSKLQMQTLKCTNLSFRWDV